jgi:hypothetical protein
MKQDPLPDWDSRDIADLLDLTAIAPPRNASSRRRPGENVRSIVIGTDVSRS